VSKNSALHIQEVVELLTGLTRQNCHEEPSKRSIFLYMQKVHPLLLNNRIEDTKKLPAASQALLATVIVQGTIAPIRIMVLKDLRNEIECGSR